VVPEREQHAEAPARVKQHEQAKPTSLDAVTPRTQRGPTSLGDDKPLKRSEAHLPGRVPHVRHSVHGPKKTGRSPFKRLCHRIKIAG
jgi:hypothetical protein